MEFWTGIAGKERQEVLSEPGEFCRGTTAGCLKQPCSPASWCFVFPEIPPLKISRRH